MARAWTTLAHFYNMDQTQMIVFVSHTLRLCFLRLKGYFFKVRSLAQLENELLLLSLAFFFFRP